MTREQLVEAWQLICSTSEEGDFTLTSKKGQWKLQITYFMDATLAQEIVSFMAHIQERKEEDGPDWHPDMFEER